MAPTTSRGSSGPGRSRPIRRPRPCRRRSRSRHRRRERRGVVDAVADHGDHAAALLEAPHGRGLVGRKHLGGDLIDGQPPGDRSATAWLSPVIIATRTPSRVQCSTASLDSGRIASSMATAPRTAPAETTWSTVRPARSHSAATGSGSSAARRAGAGRRPQTSRSSTRARAPRPASAWKPVARRDSDPACAGCRPRSRERGVSESASTAAAAGAAFDRPATSTRPARPWSACQSCRR